MADFIFCAEFMREWVAHARPPSENAMLSTHERI